MEIEAKFSIPDEQTFQRLLKTAALAGFSLGEGSVATLSDRYLDTADGAIQAGGYACRLRGLGNRYVASLKGLGGAVGAVHRRVEYEVDLAEPLQPAEWPPSTARDLALRLCDDKPLVTLVQIEQTRHSRPVYDGERRVAVLNLDRGRIGRGDRVAATYLELEAELLPDGREQDLKTLAAELQEAWGLTPETRSKFQRGLDILVEMDDDRQVEKGAEQRLTPKERAIVEQLAQEPELIARRARLLLAWDDGLSRHGVIEQARLSPRRVRHWLNAFQQRRLDIFPDRVLKAAIQNAPSPPRTAIELPTIEEPHPPMPQIELLEQPGIEPDDPMSEAGRKTFRFHYRRMVYHEPGTRLGEDIEALHDMRVATRRMRAAFRVFEDYFEPRVVAPYLKGLKRTGRALGAVRDLDVFRAKAQAYLDTLPESQQESLDSFLAVLDTQREAARSQMLAYLDSAKYLRFKERYGEFVETEGMGSLPTTATDDEPWPHRVCHVVPVKVYERLAAVRAYDEVVSVPKPPPPRLHALRIACKRLRYTLEFFAEVLGPDTKALIKQIVAMQDHLGDLQDAVVASSILRDFLVWGTWGHGEGLPAPDLAAPVIAPGVAAYLAAKQAELQHLLDTFPQAWQQLNQVEFSRMVADAVSVL